MKGLFVTLDDVPKEEKLSVVQRIMDKATRMGYVNQFDHDAGSLLKCIDSRNVIALYDDGYFCASNLFIFGKKREPLISAYDFLKEGTKKEDGMKEFKFDMDWIRGEARIELMRVIVMKLYEMGALKGRQWADLGMAYHKVINGKLYSTNTDILWDSREVPEVSVNSILRGKLSKEKPAYRYRIDLSIYPEATREVVKEAILNVAYEKEYEWNGDGIAPRRPIYSLYFDKSKRISCSIEEDTYNEMQSYTPLSVEDALAGNY